MNRPRLLPSFVVVELLLMRTATPSEELLVASSMHLVRDVYPRVARKSRKTIEMSLSPRMVVDRWQVAVGECRRKEGHLYIRKAVKHLVYDAFPAAALASRYL